MCVCFLFFFKQKTAYEMRISDWSSDVCSSDLHRRIVGNGVEVEAFGVGTGRAGDIPLGFRPHPETVVEPPQHARETAAAMRESDPQTRQALEHAAEDQARDGERTVGR